MDRGQKSMAAPDRTTIARRLKELLDQLSGFKSKPFYFAGEPAFETWRDEVARWMGNAGNHAKDEMWSFTYIVFVGRRGDLDRIWQAGLQKAERILKAVIENLENDWSEPQTEPVKQKPSSNNQQPAASIQIFNQQSLEIVFRNTTVEQMLENITDEVEKKSPERGGWLRKKLREILDDPVVKDYYEKTVEAVLKAKGG
jgi:hypothetical protein